MFLPLFLVSLLFLTACDRLPRDSGGVAPYPPPRRDLAAWPYQEVWHGLSFNGRRMGFSHLALGAADPGLYEITSENAMAFRLFDQQKQSAWRSRDWVNADLELSRFEYHLTMDSSHVIILGSVHKGMLDYAVTTGGVTTRRALPVKSPLHPVSALSLLPLRQGLEVGSKREYLVFDGETRTLSTVSQEVVAFETEPHSREAGFRLRTVIQGQEVETWLSREGIPGVERSFSGALEALPEPREKAVAHLAQSAMDKSESLVDFSLVPTDSPLAKPEEIHRLRVRLLGMPDTLAPLDRSHQVCEVDGKTWVCQIHIPPVNKLFSLPSAPPRSGSGTRDDPYLKPSPTVQSNHNWVKIQARDIVGSGAGEERVRSLLHWMGKNIRKKPVESFSALDVLGQKQGECQGYSYLFTALARSLSMPTRVVNGLVHSREYGGFLYHAWVEVLLADRWVPVDPILGQFPADATHIALVEGEEPGDLLPLARVIGHLRAEILDSGP